MDNFNIKITSWVKLTHICHPGIKEAREAGGSGGLCQSGLQSKTCLKVYIGFVSVLMLSYVPIHCNVCFEQEERIG